jgi:hypothetical protein
MTARIILAMRRARSCCRLGASAFCIAALSPPSIAAAQVIAVKTRPMAVGDQFTFFPAPNAGLGGSGIALADREYDSFVNPAKGSRLPHSFAFSAPTFFSVSRTSGGGSTFPIGVLARSGSVFGGLGLAIQSINRANDDGPQFNFPIPAETSTGESNPSHTNRYAYVMAGKRFDGTGVSFGASATWSGLSAVDGVDQMYIDSRGVDQSGSTSDLRLGVMKEWQGGQSLDALVVHSRFDLSHDVSFSNLFWDPLRREIIDRPTLAAASERTRTWGAQLQYERPLADTTWRVGARIVANRIRHPGIPDYEISRIPGDEGRSNAFNVGVGVSRSIGRTRFAVDAVYEPIVSRTWGYSDSAIVANGATMAAGSRVVDSRFRFHNNLIRAGVSHALRHRPGDLGVRMFAGVEARGIKYRLNRDDHVTGARNAIERAWNEWSGTWGASFVFPVVEVQFRSRLASGVRRPDMVAPADIPIAIFASSSSDVLPFRPVSTVTMRDVRVATHQITLSLPMQRLGQSRKDGAK